MYLERSTGWVVAGPREPPGYVRNLTASPTVHVCVRGTWRTAHTEVVPEDDAEARLAAFGRSIHASTVRRLGTELLTVRFDFAVTVETGGDRLCRSVGHTTDGARLAGAFRPGMATATMRETLTGAPADLGEPWSGPTGSSGADGAGWGADGLVGLSRLAGGLAAAPS